MRDNVEDSETQETLCPVGVQQVSLKNHQAAFSKTVLLILTHFLEIISLSVAIFFISYFEKIKAISL